MERITRAVDRVFALLERLLAVGLIVAIALNFTNAVGRYVAGFALNGVDEVEIYILIWIAFLGAAAVTWRGLHLRMDVVINACPARVRLAAWIFESVALVLVAGFVAWQSYNYFARIYSIGAVSDIARIPTWIPHGAIFVSFGLIVLIVILRGAERVSSARSECRTNPERKA